MSSEPELVSPKTVHTRLYYLQFSEYEKLSKYDIEEIKSTVQEVGVIDVNPEEQLDMLRKKLLTHMRAGVRLGPTGPSKNYVTLILVILTPSPM